MPKMIVCNGLVLSASDPGLPFLNRAFRYGDGVFESIRVRKGKLVNWDWHMERLANGLSVLRIPPPVGLSAHLLEKTLDLLEANKVQAEGKVRIQFFRLGEGPYTPTTSQAGYVIEAEPFALDPWLAPKALNVMLYTEMGLTFNRFSAIKTCNALPYIIAADTAQSAGFDDAILFAGAHLSECTSSNLFLVKAGKLYTPELAQGCLDGVMRKHICQLADRLAIPWEACPLTVADLRKSTEVFVTNSISGIRPVISIDYGPEHEADPVFSTTEMGPLTYKLHTELVSGY